MPNKEIRESLIKEKEIEKQKSSICVMKERMKSMTDYKREYIEIKDETSEKALITFKKLKKEL